MGKNILWAVIDDTLKGKFLFLLVTLLLYIGLSPVIDRLIPVTFVFDVFFSIILLSGVYALGRKRGQALVALALALPLFATAWLNNFFPQTWLIAAVSVLSILFFGYVLVLLFTYIFKEPHVTREVIYAAIIAYLLIGLLWAGIYRLTDTAAPGSFEIASAESRDSQMLYLYYSFVTLTTLGYGDVTPTADYAYSFSILEAIIGQLYLAVLIARLVGMYKSGPPDACPPERCG
jgi:hypothetical protein